MKRSILKELAPVFFPESIAIVGVSLTSVNVGHMYLESLLAAGFPRVYPVNAGGGEISGQKVYSNIKEIPGNVDLVMATVPRETVLDLIRDCADKRVKAIVLYTAGFGEAGEEGRKLESKVLQAARRGGTRIIGPNCVGPFNPSARLVQQTILPQEAGTVGVMSHSGFLFYYLLMRVAMTPLRPSKGISSGSDMDLSCADFLEYLGEDPETKIIIAYLEGIKDGRRFFNCAGKISRHKPVIVLKGGKTDAGRRASESHTGTLAVSSRAWKAMCRQTGIVAVDCFDQLIDTTVALQLLPRPKGRKVGIITTPGGLAVTSTDACNELGLEVRRLSSGTRSRLSKVVETRGTSTNNPVDLGLRGALEPENYVKKAINIVGSDPNVDMLLVAFTGPPGDNDARDKEVCDLLVEEIAHTGKPAVICGATPEGWPRGELRFLEKSSVPVYPEPVRAAFALAKLAEYSEFLDGSLPRRTATVL